MRAAKVLLEFQLRVLEFQRLHRKAFEVVTVVLAVVFSLLGSSVGVLLPRAFPERAGTGVPLDAELAVTLKELQENSAQATVLIQRLQDEVEQRMTTARRLETELKELQNQRKLLDLTPEQKEALQALVRRQLTAREIFASLDFWVGRVLPGAVFFLFGIVVTLRFRRSSQAMPSITPPARPPIADESGGDRPRDERRS